MTIVVDVHVVRFFGRGRGAARVQRWRWWRWAGRSPGQIGGDALSSRTAVAGRVSRSRASPLVVGAWTLGRVGGPRHSRRAPGGDYLAPATGPWLGGLPCEWRVDRASKGPSLNMSAAAHPSRWIYRAVRFDSAPHRTGFQPGHRFRLLFGGRAEVTTQVRHHLSTPCALPLPCLTRAGLWMHRRALALLFGCVVACRLSSGRPRPATPPRPRQRNG